MTNDKNKPANKKAAARADARRANLMKRKQQSRSRAEQDAAPAKNNQEKKED